MDGSRNAGQPCPRCQSNQTVLTERRFGQHRWFCGACEHSWLTSEYAIAPVRAQGERSDG